MQQTSADILILPMFLSIILEREEPGNHLLLNGVPLDDVESKSFEWFTTAEMSILQGTFTIQSSISRVFTVYVCTHTDVEEGDVGYARMG